MLRGLYTAASGMMAQQRRHDTVTNNIANLNTPGYKSVNTYNRSFPEMLISVLGGDNPPQGKLGKISTGVFAEESMLQMTQGDLMQTYRPQDLAISSNVTVAGAVFDASGKYVDAGGNVTFQPQVMFTVQTPNGEQRYTRDGSFQTAPDGTLLTAGGMQVLGANGRAIQIPGGWDSVGVNTKGVIYDKTTGVQMGQLMLSRVENPNDLVREGDGNFRYTGNPAGVRLVDPNNPNDRYDVSQGFLERSNVDSAQSAVDLMDAQRVYEANQKVIQAYDRSLDKAVNEIAKI